MRFATPIAALVALVALSGCWTSHAGPGATERVLTETDTRHDLRLHVTTTDDGAHYEVRLEDVQLSFETYETSSEECRLEQRRGFRAGYATSGVVMAAGLLVWPGEVFVVSDNDADNTGDLETANGEVVALGTTAVAIGAIALVTALVTDLMHQDGATEPFGCKREVTDTAVEERESSEWISEFTVQTGIGDGAVHQVTAINGLALVPSVDRTEALWLGIVIDGTLVRETTFE